MVMHSEDAVRRFSESTSATWIQLELRNGGRDGDALSLQPLLALNQVVYAVNHALHQLNLDAAGKMHTSASVLMEGISKSPFLESRG